MKVEDIIQDADQLNGQVVDVDGYLIVLEHNRDKMAYLSSSPEIAEDQQQHIRIDHSLADLRTIIRPMPTMQLLFRGVMTNPPYFYRFPIHLTAIVDTQDILPALSDITAVSLDVPYVGKTGELAIEDQYHYTAQVDYTPTIDETQQRTATAVVESQKYLHITAYDDPVEVIDREENRYARRLQNQLIHVSGWLESATSENDLITYLLFMTTSLRASMVAVGPLREATSVFLPPNHLYKLLKTHSRRRLDSELIKHPIEIIGRIDYLTEEQAPSIGARSPKLVFTNVYRVIIHDMTYLW